MGIEVEFNPDLALRKFGTKDRLEEECLPKKLKVKKVYPFLKKGQRNYWLKGEIPLLETLGNQKLSRPLASITILEATRFFNNDANEIYTKGYYQVNEVHDTNEETIHFEGMNKKENKK